MITTIITSAIVLLGLVGIFCMNAYFNHSHNQRLLEIAKNKDEVSTALINLCTEIFKLERDLDKTTVSIRDLENNIIKFEDETKLL